MEEFSILDKSESYSLPPFSDNNDSQGSFQSIFVDGVIKDYEIVSQSPINTSSPFSSKTNSNIGMWSFTTHTYITIIPNQSLGRLRIILLIHHAKLRRRCWRNFFNFC